MRMLWTSMVAGLLLAAAWPAAANSWRHGGSLLQTQRPHPDHYQRPQPPARDYRPAPPPERGGGRMTDQERRDLHRDLDRANRELYKGRR